MPVDNASVLEFAAILGEAIARAHLAGKQIEEVDRPTQTHNRVDRGALHIKETVKATSAGMTRELLPQHPESKAELQESDP